jgi:hypothetical protein
MNQEWDRILFKVVCGADFVEIVRELLGDALQVIGLEILCRGVGRHDELLEIAKVADTLIDE